MRAPPARRHHPGKKIIPIEENRNLDIKILKMVKIIGYKKLSDIAVMSRSVSESEEELCARRMWRDEINLNNRDSLLGNKHRITKIKIKLNKDKEVEIDED